MRCGLTTARTTAPRTESPAQYFLCGSSQRIWKSAMYRFLLRNGSWSCKGNLSRDNRLDRVAIADDDFTGAATAAASAASWKIGVTAGLAAVAPSAAQVCSDGEGNGELDSSPLAASWTAGSGGMRRHFEGCGLRAAGQAQSQGSQSQAQNLRRADSPRWACRRGRQKTARGGAWWSSRIASRGC